MKKKKMKNIIKMKKIKKEFIKLPKLSTVC